MEYNCLSLNKIADSITEKISIDDISTLNYISTENMIVNKAGVEEASKLPNTKKVNFYRKKDILVSNIRPYFKKIWQADNDGGASADVLIYRANQNYIDEEYLYYFLSQDSFFDFMVQTSKGTKMPRGDKNAIANYEVSFPKNIVYQRKVASIGRTIDEKIKLNKKTIANLEDLSRTLFKRWFVDFEFPDEEGNPYKSSGGVMKQEGDSSIPIDWDIKSLETIMEITSGKRPKSKKDTKEENYTIPIIGASKTMGYTDSYLFDSRILVMGRVGTHGVIQRYITKCWPSDNTLVIHSKYYNFLYEFLNTVDYKSLNRGSTQPLITQNDIKNLKLPLPNNFEKMDRYEHELNPL